MDELGCVALVLTCINGEPEGCCADCDHPLANGESGESRG
jgi:hypothetical protein